MQYKYLLSLLITFKLLSVNPDIREIASFTGANFKMENVVNVFAPPKEADIRSGFSLSSLLSFSSIRDIRSRIKLVAGLSIIPAAYIAYLVIRTNKLMNNESKWINWQSALSLNTLLSKPIQETSSELLGAISYRYQEPGKEVNLAYAFLAFSADIQSESIQLERYLQATKLLKYLKFSTFLQFNELKEQKALDAIRKLTYLKNVAAQGLSKGYQS
ncbi:hypothetical protein A3F06_00545 [candidate division TM6 bacterium RIFCSPHIGHO2_12_FULL_36_22]|nr:MAG: hypothetical protein A3F06_00545 [candidate division TM6 bacterium RIFCSPHIGHO2_12_FULL_36_22]